MTKEATKPTRRRWRGATLQMHQGAWRIKYWLTDDKTGERKNHIENTHKTDRAEAEVYFAEWKKRNGFDQKDRAEQIQYLTGEKSLLEKQIEEIEKKEQAKAKAEAEAKAKAEAEARAKEEAAKRRAEEKAEYDAALNVGDAFEAYEEIAVKIGTGEGTMRSYASQFNVFANWLKANHPEAVKMRDVTADIVSDFATFLSTKRSSSTYNKYKILFRTMWKYLADKIKSKSGENPWYNATAMPKKKTINHRRKILNLENLATLIVEADGELRCLFAIGMYTGLRLGDACTLQWEEVDLPLGVITRVPRKTAAETNNEPVTIAIHPALANLLMQAPTYADRKGPVLPEMCEMYLHDKSAVSYRVQEHFRKCGFETSSEVGDNRCRKGVDYGFHSLRSTFVTRTVQGVKKQRDEALSIAGSMAGHTTTAMTARYNHETFDDEKRLAVMAMPDLTDANAVTLSVGARVEAVKNLLANFSHAELAEVEKWISERLAQ